MSSSQVKPYNATGRKGEKAISPCTETQLSEAGHSNWFVKHNSAEQVKAGSEFHN